MFGFLKKKYIGSITRSLLLFAGGFLVASGYLTEEALQNLVAAASPAIVAALWSLVEKAGR